MSKVKKLYESLCETKDPNMEVKIVESTQEKDTFGFFKSKFKIVSSDGSPANTKIYYRETELEGVANLNISMDAESNDCFATFTVIRPLLNIELPVNQVKIQLEDIEALSRSIFKQTRILNHENCTVPKENIDQDSTT